MTLEERLRTLELRVETMLRMMHSSTRGCEILECELCSARDCPYGEALHYHHDGCPACFNVEPKRV